MIPSQNIVLIGFMCSGKSTVAQLVAAELGINHFEMDDFIVTRSGLKSVAEIFETEGETRFRDLESEACEHAATLTQTVISTGGGAIVRSENLSNLQRAGILTYLQTSFPVAMERKQLSPTQLAPAQRPLFESVEDAEAIFNSRSALYLGAADVVVHTDSKTPAEVANEVILRTRNQPLF